MSILYHTKSREQHGRPSTKWVRCFQLCITQQVACEYSEEFDALGYSLNPGHWAISGDPARCEAQIRKALRLPQAAPDLPPASAAAPKAAGKAAGAILGKRGSKALDAFAIYRKRALALKGVPADMVFADTADGLPPKKWMKAWDTCKAHGFGMVYLQEWAGAEINVLGEFQQFFDDASECEYCLLAWTGQLPLD